MTARGDGDSGVYVKSGFCGCIHKPFSSKGVLTFISSVTAGGIAGMSPFDYSRLMESTDERQHMFSLVVKESEKDLTELEEALRKTASSRSSSFNRAVALFQSASPSLSFAS